MFQMEFKHKTPGGGVEEEIMTRSKHGATKPEGKEQVQQLLHRDEVLQKELMRMAL